MLHPHGEILVDALRLLPFIDLHAEVLVELSGIAGGLLWRQYVVKVQQLVVDSFFFHFLYTLLYIL